VTRFCARIEIGGVLRRADLRKFVAALDGLPCDDGWTAAVVEMLDDGATDQDIAETLREFADQGTTQSARLRLVDPESSGGAYDDLAETCRVFGLAYDSASEGSYGNPGDPGVELWRPGMDRPLSVPTLGYLGPIGVAIDALRGIVAGLKRAVSAVTDRRDPGTPDTPRLFDAVLRAAADLDALPGMDVGPLPPFSIEGFTDDAPRPAGP
jgi:hypothetical protein